MPDQRKPSLRDAALLARLEHAFASHAGNDRLIDAEELRLALGLRSEYLAARVLAAFDTDKSGHIDRDEFLAGVRTLVSGSEREKLAFAFRIHDGDEDGFLGHTDVLRMIHIGLAEDQVITDVSVPDSLVASLWKQADTDRDGKISFDELLAVLRRRPTLLASMTRSEAIWLAPNEVLLERLGTRAPARAARVARYVENHKSALAVLAVVLVLHIVVVSLALMPASPHVPDENLDVRLVRATGQWLALDVGLVFLAVARRTLTRVRAGLLGRLVPIDAAVDFHRAMGHVLSLGAGLHALFALRARGTGHAAQGLGRYLLESERGLTGALLLVLLAVMWLFALPFIRKSQRFELFYFSHLAYLAFAPLLVVHAPFALLLAGPALILYAAERIARRRVQNEQVAVVALDALRSGVTRLEVARPQEFVAAPGDYAFLKIPAIAKHEWHPFTISSAPEQTHLVFHIRALGNFTTSLRERAERLEAAELGPVQLDGPYGSPSAAIFGSEVAVMIGAGIGVTPFASVLESIVMRSADDERALPLKKVHFFWLNRDPYSFEWFADLLGRFEASDRHDLLDLHICMTGGHAGASVLGLELARRAHQAAGAHDVVTGLSALTRMGHPDWDAVLGEITTLHTAERIDVFFCGPPGLGKKVAAACDRHRLRFHEERF